MFRISRALSVLQSSARVESFQTCSLEWATCRKASLQVSIYQAYPMTPSIDQSSPDASRFALRNCPLSESHIVYRNVHLCSMLPPPPIPIIISNDPPPPSHPVLPPGPLKAAETVMSVVSFASFSSIEVTIALVALRMALFFRITLLLTGAVCAGAVEYDH